MIRYLFAALLLVPAVASAVICKSVDADGVVSYAEVPAAECDNPVQLPEYSRYAPRIPEPLPEPAGAAATGGTDEAAAFAGYESLSISEPADGGSVRNNEGKVTVVIALTPPLRPDHRVTLTIDGQPISGRFDSLAIDLDGVDRGQHRLKARVVDLGGGTLIESLPVEFTMRQASRLIPGPQPRPGG
jgi:hypothetical protein